MSILRINAGPTGLVVHRSNTPVDKAVDHALHGDGPIIVMIHGYKYRPEAGETCPHGSIFANDAGRGADAWPRHLGFGRGEATSGLAIAFGWNARGPLLHRVYAQARQAGRDLATLLHLIRSKAPHRPLHLLTHSMGSEVAFEALVRLPANSVGRLVCLTGASFRSTALRAMASPAGRTAELINVTSRENDLFDFLFECLVAPPILGERAMGHGLSRRNIVTLQLDHPGHLAALAQLGSPIAAPRRRICHWSGYTRPGVLRLWARVLRTPEALPLDLLAPTPPAPRWSRLLAGPRLPALLPEDVKPAT